MFALLANGTLSAAGKTLWLALAET